MLSLDWNKSLLSTEGSGSSQLYSFSQTALIRFLLTIWVILRGLWHIAHRFTAASYGKKFFFFFRPLRQMRWLLLGLVTLSYWLLSMVLFLEVCFHGVCHVSTITLNEEMIVWNVFFFPCLLSVPLEGLKSQGAFEEMRQSYIRELTKAIHGREKGLVASSQRFYHLTKLMDAMHEVSAAIIHVLNLGVDLMRTKTNMNVSSLADSEEGQPVLSDHLHPGRRHESGVSRDDVRGHRLPASEGPGRHGEAAFVPHQVTTPAQTPQSLRRRPVTGLLTCRLLDFFTAFRFCSHYFFGKLHLMVLSSSTSWGETCSLKYVF